MLNPTTSHSMRPRLCGDGGITAVPVIRRPVTTADNKNQTLLESVVSTSGAHTNFHVCGKRESAARPAIAATLTPACERRYASVTTTYPLLMPCGRNMT